LDRKLILKTEPQRLTNIEVQHETIAEVQSIKTETDNWIRDQYHDIQLDNYGLHPQSRGDCYDEPEHRADMTPTGSARDVVSEPQIRDPPAEHRYQ
jgi:hypothetical protein